MTTTEDPSSGASGMTEQQASGLLGSDVREGYAEIGGVPEVDPGQVCSWSVQLGELATDCLQSRERARYVPRRDSRTGRLAVTGGLVEGRADL